MFFLVRHEHMGLRQVKPKLDGCIEHVFATGNHFGAPCHPAKVVPGVAVVTFNNHRVGFADGVPLLGQDFGEGIPVDRIKNTFFQVPHLVVKPSEGCSVTTTCNPGDSSPCGTIHRLDKPRTHGVALGKTKA